MYFYERTASPVGSAQSETGIAERYNQGSYEAKRQIGLSRFFRTLRVYYILFCLILLLMVFPYLQYPAMPIGLFATALAYGVCRCFLPRHTTRSRVVIVMLECADLFLIAGLIYLTGGIKSFFHVAFALPILACTVRFGLKSGLYSMVLAGILIGAAAFAPPPMNTIPSYFHLVAGWGTLAFGIWTVNFLVKEDLKLREELYSASVTDHLTGLYHSGYMRERVGEAVRHHRREGGCFSIVFLDLDHFKAVNDRFGHLTGDAALKHVAAVLRDATRSGETLGRYGGDEFLLLLPGTNANQAETTLQRLCRWLESRPYISEYGVPIQLGISGGAAEYPADGQNLEQLLHTADQRMYRQKK